MSAKDAKIAYRCRNLRLRTVLSYSIHKCLKTYRLNHFYVKLTSDFSMLSKITKTNHIKKQYHLKFVYPL